MAKATDERQVSAQRDGARMAQQILVAGTHHERVSEGWRERMAAYMRGGQAREWLWGVLDGAGKTLALGGEAERMAPERAGHLGRAMLDAAGPEAWSRHDVSGSTLTGLLTLCAGSSAHSAKNARVVLDGLDVATQGRPEERLALARALSAPSKSGVPPIGEVRDKEGSPRMRTGPEEQAVAAALEGWEWMAGTGGPQAQAACGAADMAMAEAQRAAAEGTALPGDPLEAMREVPAGAPRQQWSLVVAEAAFRLEAGRAEAGAGTDDPLRRYLRETAAGALGVADMSGPEGMGAIRRRDGSNLLHRLAQHPRALATAKEVIAELAAPLAWDMGAKRRGLDGKTPEECRTEPAGRTRARNGGVER